MTGLDKDEELLAACGRLRAHIAAVEQRFAEWSHRNPGEDLPDDEAAAMHRRACLLERAIISQPARTWRGAAAKAAVGFRADAWPDIGQTSITQSVLADLRAAGQS